MKKIEICSLRELEKSKIKVYENLLLIKINNQIFCIERYCTHAYGDLSEGIINEETKTVTCPIHFSTFDIKTGNPITKPAERPLKTYKVKIENNKVYVEV